MEQRGRKSAASLGVVPRIAAPPSDPVQPLENLSEPARTAFINLVSSCEPTHFTNADIGLITQYANVRIGRDVSSETTRPGFNSEGATAAAL